MILQFDKKLKKLLIDTLATLLVAVPVFIYFLLYMENISPIPQHFIKYLITAPVAEELLFRGIIQELLLRHSFSLHRSNIVTSILFTLAHITVAIVFNTGGVERLLVIFPSLVIGWHYSRNRNIFVAIGLHSIYNVSVFI